MSSFCTAKATHIFSAKNFSIFAYHSMSILTTSLALNNWAQKFSDAQFQTLKNKKYVLDVSLKTAHSLLNNYTFVWHFVINGQQ